MGRMLLTLIGCCVIVFPITAQSEVDLTIVQATVNELNALLTTLIPSEWISTGGASDIDVISSILDGIIPFVAAGDYTAAESARLEAYAMLELGIEQRLRGFAPEMAVEIESLFWQGTEGTPGLSVLLTMVGNTVHVMQSMGWLPITPIQGVYLPFWVGQWFGVFATWQGIILQVIAGVFVIGNYFLAEQNKVSRRVPREAKQNPSAV